jgi:membrane-associated protein
MGYFEEDDMSDGGLTELFLTWMLAYGAVAVGLALLLGALGLPVPGTLFVLAAGAFTRQGIMDGGGAFALGLAGVLLGDSLSYALGRYAGKPVAARFAGASIWQQAQEAFAARGAIMILLTRFLLTPLAIPTNLIAGSSGYQFWRFLGYDAAGELIWLLLFGGAGYWAGAQWEAASQFVTDFSGLLLGVALLVAAALFLVRYMGGSALFQRPQPCEIATK